jgi:hypothetical protein
MRVTVGEQEIHNHTQDRKDEDTNTPEHLVQDWSAGLYHLNYNMYQQLHYATLHGL